MSSLASSSTQTLPSSMPLLRHVRRRRMSENYARADDMEPMQDYGDDESTAGLRHVVLTSAASIKPRPVFWLWKNRLALGTLGLLAGREGVGKSTLGYWIAARITQGDLFGCFAGTPKAVLVCATEDSWEHTIVPRLMAAGANLARVYRVDVVTAMNITVGMSLPRDLEGAERAANEVDAFQVAGQGHADRDVHGGHDVDAVDAGQVGACCDEAGHDGVFPAVFRGAD